MKPLVASILSAVLAAWAAAQTAPAPATPPDSNPVPALPGTPAAKTVVAPKTAPGTKVATPVRTATGVTVAGAAKADPKTKGAADKSAKKDEPPPKIEGMEIGRGAKGFLGLQVVGGNFKLSFYDAKKKPVAPDVVRAVLRWTPNYKPGTEIYVLGPGDGKSLTVAKTVRPPYNFKLFVSLFAEGVDDPVESFVVDFRQ